MWVKSVDVLRNLSPEDYINLKGRDIRYKAAGLLPRFMRRWVYKKVYNITYGCIGGKTGFHIAIWCEPWKDGVWFRAENVEINV